MPLRHNNPTQNVEPVEFRPLLRNESPYFNNLNRGPKDAYTYADSLNKMLSYGGCVSRLKPQVPNTLFALYNLVTITNSETIQAAANSDTRHTRVGIVVTEADIDGYYIVCTFCPNFVYPSITPLGAAAPGDPLYLDSTVSTYNVSTSASSVSSAEIGFHPIARVTGTNSIFFSGTLRSLTA